MAPTVARLLLAAAALVNVVAGYKAKEYGAMIEAATSPSSPIPSGINFLTNTTANVTELPAQFYLDRGSKRAKLLYGPFEVPPMSEKNGMIDYLMVKAQMPCKDCTITFLQAGLQYPDGSYANANTSMWLHHTLFINVGKTDTVCGPNYYGKGQRWFASGNERTAISLTMDGILPTGYYWGESNVNLILVELMNQAMRTQNAVLTVTYEWIPGFPSDFHDITPIWLDISGCDGASDEPVKSDTAFNYVSPVYQSNFDGVILGMGAHLHDGGVYADVVKNGTTQCQAQAFYGETPGFWDQAGVPMTMNPEAMDAQMSMGDMRMPHISSLGRCYAPAGVIEIGDEWGVNAYYNFTEDSPMLNSDGSDAEIMGISMVFAVENMTQSQLQRYVGYGEPNPYPNGTFVPHLTPYSPAAEMTCVPMRDAPGTLSAATLDLSDENSAMLYLMAILDDACLQVWSEVYARGFWYAIIGVIALATLVNRGQMLLHIMRLRKASKSGAMTVWSRSSHFSRVFDLFRAFSYPQLSPTRIPSLFKIPNFGISFMIVAYAGLLCLLTFLHTNTHDDQRYQSVSVRAAWITVAQIPLAIVLANKRNFVGLITGVTYERLNVLHRWTARGLLLTATLHFGYQSYGWARLGLMKLEWATDDCPTTGIAAYALLLWMNLTTLAPFRNAWYELFVVQHIITFMGFIIAATYHIPDTALGARTYVFVGVGLYLASRLVQTAFYVCRNLRPGRATLTPLSPKVTKIVVRNPSLKSWTPGSHVLIRFPGVGFWQSHPATISSTPDSHNGDLVFYLRAHKGFSRNLHKAASKSGDDSSRMSLIDGPYGGAQPDFAAFHTSVLIASSTGITFTLPILLDIAARASKHRTLPLRRIEFIWTVRDGEWTTWLTPELKSALSALRNEGIRTDVTIHITGTSEHDSKGDAEKAEGSSGSDSSASASTHSASESDGEKKDNTRVTVTRHASWRQDTIPVVRSRCDVSGLLRSLHREAEGEMGVAVCGSFELSKKVRNSVAAMQGGKKGVFLHVEGFGW